MRREFNTRTFRWILAVIFIFVVVFFIISFIPSGKVTVEPVTTPTSDPDNDRIALEAKRKAAEIEAFSKVKIIGKAAYVFDMTDNRAIFAKNENIVLPLASVTKLMTALAASRILSDNDNVTISTASLETDGESGLEENEKWRFEDLRDFTLMVSSNDGASAIAEAAALKLTTTNTSTSEVDADLSHSVLEDVFVEKMNREAISLNLSTLNYQNPSGLDVNPAMPGAVGSARNIAELLKYMIKTHPNILDITKYASFTFTSLSDIRHHVSNTDEVINKVSRILASKTGYTQLAGGNLVVAYDPGLSHIVIIVILGSTSSGRFSDIMALASSTALYLKTK